MALLRLTGGLTPADPADPRTFPGIYNAMLDYVEAIEAGGGGGGVSDHNALDGRFDPGQHSIGSITGLQSALDGKQTAGNYAQANHTHDVSHLNVTGTPNGSRFLRDDGTWASPPAGDGSGFTDHNSLTGRNDPDQHSIIAVTGLQSALDGKQPTGNYVLSSDSRLSDDRAPTPHAESHGSDGADRIYPEDIGAVASLTIRTIVPMTQAEYDALPTKNATTLYVVP